MSQNVCINVHSTNVNSENLSRQNMLKWVNDVLGTRYKKIEDLSKGDAYCRFMDIVFPGCIPIKKVKVDPNQEFEFIQNYKYVQAAFKKVGCDKDVPIGRLVKGRFQDNLEFVQWFRKFFLVNSHGQGYEVAEGISHDEHVKANGTGSSAAKVAAGVSKTRGNTTFDKKIVPGSYDRSQNMEINELAKQAGDLKLNVSSMEKERDFYYHKLQQIEVLCKNGPESEFKGTVLKILYSQKDGSASGNEEDSPELGDDCF